MLSPLLRAPTSNLLRSSAAPSCGTTTSWTALRVIAGIAVICVAVAVLHSIWVSLYQVHGRPISNTSVVGASIVLSVVLTSVAILLPHPGARTAKVYGPLKFALAACLVYFVGTVALTIAFDPGTGAPGVSEPFKMMLVAAVSPLILVLLLAALWLVGRGRRQFATKERQLRDLIDLSQDGLLICHGGTIVRLNHNLEGMLNRGTGNLAGRSIDEVVAGITGLPAGKVADLSLKCANAERIPVRASGREIMMGGRPYLAVSVRDPREVLLDESKMMLLELQDSLTGMANRLSFNQTLAGRCLSPGISDDAFALLMLNLDRFKAVNDTYGHGVGEELLRRVAARLTRAVHDRDLVARLDGDEFAIVANIGGDIRAARRIACDIIDLICRPFLIEGQIINIGVSLGIAFAPGDGNEPATLSRNAGLALHRAKEGGGSAFRIFEADMSAKAEARSSLELDLRGAMKRQEFEVYYQPLVAPRSGKLVGAEALVRWRHPRRNMVSPGDFIPLAEEIGLIGSIGDWVLRTACAEAAGWPEHLFVAVNLSPVQFRDPDLALRIAATLADTRLPGTRLEVEITEGTLLQEGNHTLDTLHALRAHGVRISMDDFGTGYSSLSYLRRFPFDKIKIDQSFLRQIPDDPDSVAIVQAIVSLGAKLGMTVTAEGVETADQRAFAVAEGCDEIQGYLISKPIPASEMRKLFIETHSQPIAERLETG